MVSGRTLPGDWNPGTTPDNAEIDETAFIETTYSFRLYRSEAAAGLHVRRGASVYCGTMFDVGPRGTVRIGEYSLINGAWIICDSEIEIGDYTLVSWNVVLMDSYRVSANPDERRAALERLPGSEFRRLESSFALARPIRIGRNVWIGFDVCVLPGVSVGEGSVVGARSVVIDDVPAYCVAAGNPARIIRELPRSGQ